MALLRTLNQQQQTRAWLRICAFLVVLSTTLLLARWQLDTRRLQDVVVGSAADTDLVRGFHDRERSAFMSGRPFRWTIPSRAHLHFWAPNPSAPAVLSLWMSMPERSQLVTVQLSDAVKAEFMVGSDVRRYQILLNEHPFWYLRVDLRSPPFTSVDPRELGVVVWRTALASYAPHQAGALLGELIVFPQLPLLVLIYAWGMRRRPGLLSLSLPGLGLGLAALMRLTDASILIFASIGWYIAFLIGLAAGLAWLIRRLPWIVPQSDRGAAIALLGCFLVIFGLTFSPALFSDGIGYYAYVHSLIIDRDLDLRNQYARLWQGLPLALVPATGLAPNPWSIGPALLWLPAYQLTHWIVTAAATTPFAADGYSEPYVVAVTASTALALLVFLWATYRVCRRWTTPGVATVAALNLWLGSTLWYYSMRLGTFAHAFSAASAALFLLAWIRLEERQSLNRWVAVGFAVGLMTLIYWPTALLALPVGLVGARRALVAMHRQRWHELAALVGCAVAALLMAGLVFTPQMLAWKIIYGAFLVKPEATPQLVVQSHLLAMLFEPYGLLFWTPAMFLGIVGVVLLWKQAPWICGGLLLSFGVFLLYNSMISDWHGSGAFGLRRLTAVAAWPAVGLALLYEQWLRARRHTLVVFTFLATSLWMLMLLIRYDFRYFPDRTPLGLGELPASDFFLARSTFPFWELWPYITSGYVTHLTSAPADSGLLFLILAAVGLLGVLAGLSIGLGYRYIRDRAAGKRLSSLRR